MTLALDPVVDHEVVAVAASAEVARARGADHHTSALPSALSALRLGV